MRIPNWTWTLLVLLGLWWLGVPGELEPIDSKRLEERIQLINQEPPDPSIVIIGVDDAVFQADRYNRLEHARLIDRLGAAGVRGIFLDLIFDEPRGDQFDVPLAEAIRRSGRVVVAGVYQANSNDADLKILRPTFFPQLQELVKSGACQMGIINTSHTGSKNETLLAVVDPIEDRQINPFGPGVRLSAAAALYAISQHLKASDVESLPATVWHGEILNIPPLHVETSGTMQKGVTNLKAPLYFHPPATGPVGKPGAPGRLPVIPYLKIADGDPEALRAVKNKFVLIGDNRQGSIDLYTTPVGDMKGVEIHAQAFDMLLQNRIPRFPIEGSVFMYEAELGIVLLCLICSWLLQSQPNMARCAVVAVVCVACWEAAVMVGDRHDAYLPQTLGEFALFVTCLLGMIVRFRATYRILRTFIPAAIVDQLIQDVIIHQGAVEATVMVTDIRGYTTLSESRTPTQVLDLLNDYHTETVAHYQKFGGHVLNYQGDAQIILFGHPKPLADAPRQAILAAQAASGAVEVLRKRWKLPADQAFNVGAGICTGAVIIADLGGMHREYTVIGELVRKCHKLQSQSQILKANIILDEETFLRCRTKPDVEKREDVSIDGLAEPVTVYITDLVPD